MNMYKIEKKKQEELNQRRKDLEGVVANDEEIIQEMQSMINTFKDIGTLNSLDDLDSKLGNLT